jgi:hypothetical protein
VRSRALFRSDRGHYRRREAPDPQHQQRGRQASEAARHKRRGVISAEAAHRARRQTRRARRPSDGRRRQPRIFRALSGRSVLDRQRFRTFIRVEADLPAHRSSEQLPASANRSSCRAAVRRAATHRPDQAAFTPRPRCLRYERIAEPKVRIRSLPPRRLLRTYSLDQGAVPPPGDSATAGEARA